VVTTLAPVRQRYVELPHNPEHVRAVLRTGAKRARELTSEKVRQAKEAIGLLPA
jgi:tryptophanyl-tRNA synthetase